LPSDIQRLGKVIKEAFGGRRRSTFRHGRLKLQHRSGKESGGGEEQGTRQISPPPRELERLRSIGSAVLDQLLPQGVGGHTLYYSVSLRFGPAAGL
jgi:hypothetical protein